MRKAGRQRRFAMHCERVARLAMRDRAAANGHCGQHRGCRHDDAAEALHACAPSLRDAAWFGVADGQVGSDSVFSRGNLPQLRRAAGSLPT